MVEYIIPIENVKPLELKIQNNYIDTKTVKERIAIVGTGNYGIALGRRLMNAEYEVVFGSRNPNPDYLRKCFGPEFENYSVTSIGDALLKCDELAFLAVSAKDCIYESVVDDVKKLNEKFFKRVKPLVLIDISNRLDNQQREVLSNAEKLDSLVKSTLPNLRVNVVKGFNLTSAYNIGQDQFTSKSTLNGGKVL